MLRFLPSRKGLLTSCLTVPFIMLSYNIAQATSIGLSSNPAQPPGAVTLTIPEGGTFNLTYSNYVSGNVWICYKSYPMQNDEDGVPPCNAPSNHTTLTAAGSGTGIVCTPSASTPAPVTFTRTESTQKFAMFRPCSCSGCSGSYTQGLTLFQRLNAPLSVAIAPIPPPVGGTIAAMFDVDFGCYICYQSGTSAVASIDCGPPLDNWAGDGDGDSNEPYAVSSGHSADAPVCTSRWGGRSSRLAENIHKNTVNLTWLESSQTNIRVRACTAVNDTLQVDNPNVVLLDETVPSPTLNSTVNSTVNSTPSPTPTLNSTVNSTPSPTPNLPTPSPAPTSTPTPLSTPTPAESTWTQAVNTKACTTAQFNNPGHSCKPVMMLAYCKSIEICSGTAPTYAAGVSLSASAARRNTQITFVVTVSNSGTITAATILATAASLTPAKLAAAVNAAGLAINGSSYNTSAADFTISEGVTAGPLWPQDSHSDDGLSGADIAGIVVGTIVGVLMLAGVIWYVTVSRAADLTSKTVSEKIEFSEPSGSVGVVDRACC